MDLQRLLPELEPKLRCGIRVRCITVTGLSMLEMGDMWISFNERISRARFNLSPQLVRDIIEAEIDFAVSLVN